MLDEAFDEKEEGKEEEFNPVSVDQIKEKMKLMKEKEDNKGAEDRQEKKEEVPEDVDDLIKIITHNSQKEEKVLPEGNEFDHIECFFKKIKKNFKDINKKNIDSFPPEIIKNWNKDYGIFYCNKENEITKEKCEPEKEICADCMKNTQKMYGLKPHYLINSMGRVCTYKKGNIFCLGKFSKIIEENKINYSINYVCGHSGQCNSCKSLTEKKEKYFGSFLMNKLLERDKSVN